MGIFKQFVPPVLLKPLRKIYNRSLLLFLKPNWHTIQTGLLKGRPIYINDTIPYFKEMIAGSYDAFFWDYLKNRSFEGTTLIDIGAHIGYHTLGFAQRVGEKGHVVAFEPNPYNLERIKLILSKNADLNSRIILFPFAVSNAEADVSFNFSKNIEDVTSSGGYLDSGAQPLDDAVYETAGFITETVKTKRLDDLVGEHQYTNISLIKIDVEGAEHWVLEGAIQTLRTHHPLLLIEVHSITAMLSVCTILHKEGYDIQLIKEDNVSRCFVAATPTGTAHS